MRRSLSILLAFACLTAVPVARAGTLVRVIGSEEIRAGAQHSDEHTLQYTSYRGRALELGLDPSRLSIQNPALGDGFHPADPDLVARILDEMRALPEGPAEVRVYLLPGMPREMGSFAQDGEVFLAPALAEWDPRTLAVTLVHEFGHALQHQCLPGRDGEGWRRYLQVRGIDDATRYHESAAHRDRPGEIFAEDFRLLYGGPLSVSSGTLENPDLPLPESVPGLSEFFEQALAGDWRVLPAPLRAENRPNPFNPRTVIHLELELSGLDSVGRVELTVYDLRGRRVRGLGSHPARPILLIPFDGMDDAGSPLASGRYFYRVSWGERVVSGSMLLAK